MTFVPAGIAALAGFMAAMWISLVSRAGRSAALGTAGGIVVVAGIQWALAANGTLSHWDRLPPPFMLVLAVSFVLTVGLALSPIGGRVADASTVTALVVFQVFRLPLELVMHRAALENIMPMQMTYTGWNFDIVTGSTAILVAGLASMHRAPRWLVVGWNLLGTTLLLAIIAIAVASTPIVAAFGSSPDRLNTWVAEAPYVWLPGILVQAALFGHIVLWRKLLRSPMLKRSSLPYMSVVVSVLLVNSWALRAQTPPQPAPAAPTRADILRGEYGRYRSNNDLLWYHLDVRVDPDKKTIAGKNTIRFKMLRDDTRIQLDLYANLNVDKIVMGTTPLKYERELNTVWVDFPETLAAGRTVAIDFYYSGTPTQTGRFGGFTFSKDPAGRPWIFTACEGEGASIWWPNKDQWRDEVENMEISVAIPTGLVDVSNGKFVKKTDLGDGYTRWDWNVQYPINNYSVSLNIGTYVHFDDRSGDMPLDFYALPEDLDKAKTQFAQARGMIAAYEHYFGEYPFKKDGYKLIEAPYTGMEHQSAVTYGNGFANGYGGRNRDWTGVGISLKFDFIIIHESGHEWFGNAVSAADVSDMWIHEGWTTYLECLYVEYTFGKEDGLKYTNGYKSHVQNRTPIITPRGQHKTPPQDMYFKGALMLATLRSIVDDDAKWFRLIHDLYQHFKYQNIMTEDVVAFFNQQTGKNLTPIFDEYLRHAALPTLELTFDEAKKTVSYRWKADESAFAMPVRVGRPGAWQLITPTTTWQTMPTSLTKDEFEVATDLYYVNVAKQ